MVNNNNAALMPQDWTRPRFNRQVTKPVAPEPETLLVLDKGDKETRFKLSSYQGHPYVSVETWARQPNGVTVPTGRTVSLRMRDLPAVIHVLSSLVDEDVDMAEGGPCNG